MEISSTLLKDFAKAVNTKNTENKPASASVYGTTVVSDGKKYVQLDGSSALTPIAEATEAEDGDRVLVTIENHKATVIGNFTYPASARTANDALEKAEDAIDISEENAGLIDSAEKKADEAKSAASSASALASQAISNASNASKKAETAYSLANQAKTASSSAQSKITVIQTDIKNVQNDINTARQEAIDNLNTVVETMSTTYASKTDLSDVEGTLSAEISNSAAELSSTMAETYAAKTDLTSVQSSLETQITQTAGQIELTAQQVSSLVTDTDDIKKDVLAAQQAAQGAQSAANAAQAAADTAQQKADEADQKVATAQSAADAAQADLNTAKQNLEAVTSRVGATEEEIATAQQAVTEAQKAVDKAQKDVVTAQNAADAAQKAADTAQGTADEAKATADKAAQDLADISTRVTKAETTISQNSKAISLAATKTEVSETLEGYYTKTETDAQITISADGINQTVSETYSTKTELSDVEHEASEAKNASAGNADSITQLTSRVTQLADSIKSLVTNGEGGSLMVQNGDSFTFNFGPVQALIDGLSNDVNGTNGLKASYNDMMKDLQSLQGVFDDNGDTFEYVKVSTYNDAPAIFLGESDSNFKVIITNTKIIFLRGTNEGTYVDTDGLKTDNITVNNELKQGGFSWVTHGSGNLGLVWKGV